jgi:hypothetical protein
MLRYYEDTALLVAFHEVFELTTTRAIWECNCMCVGFVFWGLVVYTVCLYVLFIQCSGACEELSWVFSGLHKNGLKRTTNNPAADASMTQIKDARQVEPDWASWKHG